MKHKKKLIVKEGSTGILYLTYPDGIKKRFVPSYDLDKAKKLLSEFMAIKGVNSLDLKYSYKFEGLSWFPTVVSYLYWHVFYKYIQYEPILREVISGGYKVTFKNRLRFYTLYRLFYPEFKIRRYLKAAVYRFLIKPHNKTVLAKGGDELLFYRYGPYDFRTEDIKKALDELGVKYLQAYHPTIKIILKFLPRIIWGLLTAKPLACYFLGWQKIGGLFNNDYQLPANSDEREKALFKVALRQINDIISSFISEYKVHSQLLSGSNINVFYGLDDINDVFPIIYACKKLTIKTVGHQHGLCYLKQNVAYMMPGIDSKEYEWYDKVIVWGKYWQDNALANSKVYAKDLFVVGSHRRNINLSISEPKQSGTDNKGVLIPYEFLANTERIGAYIMKFIDLGFRVYLKPRPDEKISAQLQAYCLPEIYSKKLNLVYDVSGKFMDKIDIILGSGTTFFLEMVPYRKKMCILDTDFKLLKDFVDAGYMKVLKYEDIACIGEGYRPNIDILDYLFSSMLLKDAIRKYVLKCE